jgi:hypothetical protein
MKKHILVLGDGNLSFSMALAHLIEDTTNVVLLATSFDSEEALLVRFHATFFSALSAYSQARASGNIARSASTA